MKPFTHAALALGYIALVVLVMQWFTSLVGLQQTLLIPIAVLGLFVLSAAVMGYLFLYRPLALFADGKHREAVSFFVRTVGVFAVLVAVYLIALFLIAR